MKSLALLVLMILTTSVRSQSIYTYVINSTGNNYSQGYYNIDWSVGELSLINSMQPGNEMIITNGFLQPLPSNYDQDARRHFTINEVRIMPNPTHGKIEVNFSTAEKGTLYLFVYDANGKMLTNDKMLSSGYMASKFIDLTSFASSSYLLRIELVPSPGSVTKTGSYKIIKL